VNRFLRIAEQQIQIADTIVDCAQRLAQIVNELREQLFELIAGEWLHGHAWGGSISIPYGEIGAKVFF
jgi:hypothetical protein